MLGHQVMRKTAKKSSVARGKTKRVIKPKETIKTSASPRKLVAKAARKAQELGQDLLDKKLLAIADRSLKTIQARIPDLSAQALDQTVNMGERVLQRVKQARKAMTSRSEAKRARR